MINIRIVTLYAVIYTCIFNLVCMNNSTPMLKASVKAYVNQWKLNYFFFPRLYDRLEVRQSSPSFWCLQGSYLCF